MFFLGVNFGESAGSATYVVLKKTLKNIKKHYHLNAIKRFPSGIDYPEIENEIIKTYNDRKFIVNKRIFSQDRRPAKNVRVCPTIVAGFTGMDTDQIDNLRKKKIPVEGISVYREERWQRENYGPICLGNNYYVPEGELIRNLSSVFKQNRLIIENEIPFSEYLINEIEVLEMEKPLKEDDISEGRLKENDDVISALSMPLWFCETIRIIRRY